jgi:hypothetical protein
MLPDLVLVGFGVGVFWLLLLTLFLWRTIAHYNKLTTGVSDKSLKAVLEKLLKDSEFNKKELDYLKDYCAKIEKDGLLHIQKVGLVRFILLKIQAEIKVSYYP